MAYDLTGKLFEVFAEQQVSDKFKKREMVVEVPDGSYTQYIKLQLTQDKCSLLDSFKVGDEIKVAFNLNGKPFTKNGTTMYFTSLTAWRIEAANGSSSAAPVSAHPYLGAANDPDNDLPF